MIPQNSSVYPLFLPKIDRHDPTWINLALITYVKVDEMKENYIVYFYAWVLARIARNEDKRSRLSTEIGKKLGNKWDGLKKSRVGGKDALIRTSFYATRLLFYSLRDHLS